MKDQKLKDNAAHLKQQFIEMPKKRKIIAASIMGAVIIFAVILTVMLNAKQSEYRPLYQNIDSSEAGKIYQALKDMGATTKMNDKGEVLVLSSEYDVYLLQMAELGYPQTTPSYDVFSSNSTMTTTEAERKQWLIYQLQDRVQETLKRLNGVSNAVVTISMPENTDYIWEQATNKERASASVLLTLKPDAKLLPGQVTAIKNLIAAGVPQMEAADVTTVDAQTMLELLGETTPDGVNMNQSGQFEQTVQKQIEDNIVRLLTPRYGEEGVVAVAKVTINYDKMITERMELLEKPVDADGNGGGGFLTHSDGEYTVNGTSTIGGIAGEENNTEVPTYSYATPGNTQDDTQYAWNTDLEYSYIKTQVEKGNADLERATVSVMVDDPLLTPVQATELAALISKSVDIEPELISVSNFDNVTAQPPVVVTPEEPEEEASLWARIPIWAYIAVGVVILILSIMIAVFVSRRRKAKLMREEEEAMLREEEERRRVEEEILAYKRQFSEGSDTESMAKDEAIMEEVKGFVRNNPEISANLLRSWLREDDSE